MYFHSCPSYCFHLYSKCAFSILLKFVIDISFLALAVLKRSCWLVLLWHYNVALPFFRYTWTRTLQSDKQHQTKTCSQKRSPRRKCSPLLASIPRDLTTQTLFKSNRQNSHPPLKRILWSLPCCCCASVKNRKAAWNELVSGFWLNRQPCRKADLQSHFHHPVLYTIHA